MGQRILFDRNSGLEFFSDICAQSGLTLEQIAAEVGVSSRTVRGWRSGETSMPYEIADAWSNKYHLPLPKHQTFDLEEKRSAAGSLGGRARMELHGNFGTLEGRKKGGLQSVRTHELMGSSPFVARAIRQSPESPALAELVGAILGDGCITEYQLTLYSNIKDETEYADYLCRLILEIFGFEPSVVPDPSHGVIRILCSRKKLVEYLKSIGLGVGSKTRGQVRVPAWIYKNSDYVRACIRGLIDTDGCVYLDRHTVKGRGYSSACIAFTNASIPLLDFVEQELLRDGYSPTRSGRDIRLRRQADIRKYVEEIGFSNPKHSKKIEV